MSQPAGQFNSHVLLTLTIEEKCAGVRSKAAIRHLTWNLLSFLRCVCSLEILNFLLNTLLPPPPPPHQKKWRKLNCLFILFPLPLFQRVHTITLALIPLKRRECARWGRDIEGNWSSPCPGYSHTFGEWREGNRSASLSERQEREGNRTADKRLSALISLASSIVGSSVCRSAARGGGSSRWLKEVWILICEREGKRRVSPPSAGFLSRRQVGQSAVVGSKPDGLGSCRNVR